MVVLMGVVARVMVIDLPNDPVPRPFRDDERGIDVKLLYHAHLVGSCRYDLRTSDGDGRTEERAAFICISGLLGKAARLFVS